MAAMESYGNLGLLRHDGGSPGNWVRIANVKSYSGPDMETAFNDSTDFDSVGGDREFRPSLRDPGNMELGLNYKPGAATFEALQAQQDNRQKHKFRLVICDADEGTRIAYEFDAFVQRTGHNFGEVDGFMECSVGLRITGRVNRNSTAYPTISVAVSPVELTEGGSPSSAMFTITQQWADSKPTEIGLAWTGTATHPDDYTRPADTSVTIEPGQTSVTVGPVTIVNDVGVESPETVILTIDPEIDGHTLTGTLAATLTLNSEDV